VTVVVRVVVVDRVVIVVGFVGGGGVVIGCSRCWISIRPRQRWRIPE